MAAAGMIAWLGFTENGLNSLLSQLQARLPGTLTCGAWRGYLLGRLECTDLHYTAPGQDIAAKTINFQWNFQELRRGTLHIEQALAEGLHIRFAPAKTAAKPAAELNIPVLPLRILIDDLQLTDLRFGESAEKFNIIQNITMRAQADREGYRIERLEISAFDATVKLKGSLLPARNLATDLNIAWQWQPPGRPAIKGGGTAKGDKNRLELRQTLTEPSPATLIAEMQTPLNPASWQAVLDLAPASLRKFGPQLPELQVGGQIKASGDKAGMAIKGEVGLKSKSFGDWNGRLDLAQAGKEPWSIKTLRLEDPQRWLNLAGTVQPAGAKTQGKLNLSWRGLIWPLTGTPKASSAQGELQLTGELENYALRLKAPLKLAGAPDLDLDVAAKGDAGKLKSDSLIIHGLNGTLLSRGEVRWTPHLAWDLHVDGKGLNPGAHWRDWPGDLALSGHTTGDRQTQSLRYQVDDLRLNGRLRTYALEAIGALAADEKTISIKGLRLSSGASRLDASGTLGETLALAWRLDSPRLAELYPRAQGRFLAQGQLTGTRAAPRIDASLNGAGIAVAKTRIRELKGTLAADLRAGQGFKVQLDARDLALSGREITSIAITGGGSTERHQVEAKLDGKDQDLDLRIDGGLRNKQWAGQILKLDLSDRKLGNWTLAKPARLQAASGAFDFSDPLCLSRDAARLCAHGHWSASAGWAGDVRSESFPLTLLAPVLPAGTQLSGVLSGTAAASGLGRAIKTASADLNASDGQFEQKPQQGEATKLGFQRIQARLNHQGAGARADVDLDLTEPAGATGAIHLETAPFDPSRVDFKTLPLKGTLRMKLPHVESLVKYSSEIKELKGSLDTDLRFSGTAAKPQLGGTLALNKAGMSLPRLGIKLEDLGLQATGKEGQALAISGSARSGQGLLKLSGQVNPSLQGEWPVVLKITGDKVQVVHLPEAEVAVSPALDLKYQPQRLAVTGLVKVPSAKLQPQKSASAVSTSKDVQVLGEKKEPGAAVPAGLATTADIRVEMGEQVQVKAQGFEGKLEGAIRVIKGLDGPINGAGELFVRKGVYAMYGQKLTIDPGRVIFTGGPIDEPALDIRATRKVDNILAGARIQGPLKQPVTTLYSEPSLPQDQILSYLVLGRRVDKLSGTDGDMLMNAASALGFKGGAAVTKRIAGTLGLDELKFESQAGASSRTGQTAGAKGASSTATTALVIGKYLTPKLYVSYGVGLFRAMSSVRLRYIFGKHWSVETETGAQTGVDLLYSIER